MINISYNGIYPDVDEIVKSNIALITVQIHDKGKDFWEKNDK